MGVPCVPCVLVHGGAGDVPEARRSLHAAGCLRAARAGREVLRAGGSALDAAVRAVEVLEDDELFNAGRGASLTEHGRVELDASVMEGERLRAGAVCALPPFAHPAAIARAVLEEGRHVLYAAHGAEAFARANGFEALSDEALITEAARARWESVRAGSASQGWAGGTVGAVAFDGAHVAAATSTGGTMGKRAGRVGDSPIVGAGTWADDRAGAVSCTGAGEAILRVGMARGACERMRAGRSATEAAEESVRELRERVEGEGGLIAVSPRGELGWAKNTATMSHAWAAVDGSEHSGV